MMNRRSQRFRNEHPRLLAQVKRLADNIDLLPKAHRDFARSLVAQEIHHGLTDRQLLQVLRLNAMLTREKYGPGS
jgi:hypothetical protein